MGVLHLNEDGSERLQYNLDGLPVRTREDPLSSLFGYAAACHWHDDFELLAAAKGEIDYFVSGRRLHLLQGQAVFVNSGRLHYGYSARQENCVYRFVVFHPDLFSGFPALAAPAAQLIQKDDYLLLDGSRPEHARILQCLGELAAQAHAPDPFSLAALCAQIMQQLCALCDAHPAQRPDPDWNALRRMTGYIQSRYQDRLTLNAIAASGAVCRSRCTQLFRRHLGVSPIAYVNRYRLSKACEHMLSGKSMLESALLTGFESASYFSETFKKIYGVTPTQYLRMSGGPSIKNGPAEP